MLSVTLAGGFAAAAALPASSGQPRSRPCSETCAPQHTPRPACPLPRGHAGSTDRPATRRHRAHRTQTVRHATPPRGHPSPRALRRRPAARGGWEPGVHFKTTRTRPTTMVTMSELDSTAGLDGRSISTSGTLLIVQAGTPLALFTGSHGASRGHRAHQGDVRDRGDASSALARAHSRRGGRALRRAIRL